MSNEITFQGQLQVRNGNLQYQSYPNLFRADQSAADGPSPGALTVPTTGVAVSLSQLILPGFVFIQNLDNTNYISYGLKDGSTFRPFGECLAGEFNIFRLSRTVLTANGGADVIWLVANTATCQVVFNAFET